MSSMANHRTRAAGPWLVFALLAGVCLAAVGTQAATVSAPSDLVVPEGQSAAVSIQVTDAGSDVLGVDLVLRYDGDVLTATGIELAGTATEGWTCEYKVVEGVDGSTDEIRISAASAQDPLPATGTAVLLKIDFQAAAAVEPQSSPLNFTLAELNEEATGVTAVDGTVKLGGVTGQVTLSPDPLRPAQVVRIRVEDADLNQNGAQAETVTVQASSKTAGGASKETRTVTLTETGADTGVFTGEVSTAYGASADPGTAELELIAGEQVEVTYADALNADGDAADVVVAADVSPNVDGTVSSSPATIDAGDVVTVQVEDADVNGDPTVVDTVTVRVINANTGEVETLLLRETGPDTGVFQATLPTDEVSSDDDDGTLAVSPGDQITVEYDDAIGSDGQPHPDQFSVTPQDGSFTSLPDSLTVTDSLRVELTDGFVDTGNGTRVNGRGSLQVTVENQTTGETEDVILTESTAGSGVFQGALATTYDLDTQSNTTPDVLEIRSNDQVVVTYQDQLGDSGAQETFTSAAIPVKGTDGTVSTSPAAVDPPASVTVSVSDIDLGGRDTLSVEVQVRRGGALSETETVVLSESETSPGTFEGSIQTVSSANPVTVGELDVQPGDQIVAVYDDEAGADGQPRGDVLSLIPTNGRFGVPDSLKVGDPLVIALADSDFTEGTRVSGAATLVVTVRDTTTNEMEHNVVLVEDPAGSGIFGGSLGTVYDDDPSNNDIADTLEVRPGDVIVVYYGDGLGASGEAVTVSSAFVDVGGGSDGTVETAAGPIVPGDSIAVSVVDSDLGDSGTVEVTARSKRGGVELEAETIILTATGSGNEFTGMVHTVYDTVLASGDSVLQVRKDDEIVVDYLDEVTTSGAPEHRISTPAVQVIGGTTGTVVTSAAVQAGDSLRIQVTDPDLDVDSGAVDSVSVTVSTTRGDTETVALAETGVNTGIFRVVPPYATSGDPVTVADSVLQVSRHDSITVSYADALDDDGGPQAVTAGLIGVLWGDTSDNGKLGALDASLILQYSVGLVTFDAYQERVGDVNASGTVNSYDASFVLQRVVGIISSFPVQSHVPDPHPYKKVVDDRVLALGAIQRTGSLLNVPVLVDDARGVLSGEVRIAFDPEDYRVVQVTQGEATGDFMLATNTVDGELIVAFAGTRADHDGSESILNIQLQQVGDGSSSLEISQAQLNGGRFQVDIAPSLEARPQAFVLLQNRPNPFNPSTVLRYELPEACQVRLDVFDTLGQHVRTLMAGYQDAGVYQVEWNGRDETGRAVASGMYLYRLNAGTFSQIRKMTLLR